jgi:signal transduction histidine kinase/CheY-like chemotaxis protein
MDLIAPDPPTVVLRGRDGELGRLQAALGVAGARVVVIAGPAGAGKSALAAAAASRSGLLIGAAHFPPSNALGAAPLAAAVEAALAAALEDLFDPAAALDTLSTGLGDAALAFAGLSRGVLQELAARAVGGVRLGGVTAAAERLGHALARVCRWLTDVRGELLLVLDDWARGGGETSALLARLLIEVPGLRILATERTDEPLRVTLPGPQVHIDLTPLGPSARTALVADRLDGDTAAATELIDFLENDAPLPFELIEAVEVLKASGGLARTDLGWTLDRGRAAGALGSTLAARLAGRIAEAGAGPRIVADGLAVLGDAAEILDLAAGLGLDYVDAQSFVRRLETLGVVRRAGEAVRFTHDRILSAVLDAMDPSRRQGLAGRLAEALRERGAPPAPFGRGAAMLNTRLAGGLATADPGPWATLFLEGAELARGVGAAGRAAAWSEAALQLARRAGPVPPRVFRERVHAAVERGEVELGKTLADEMLEVSRTPAERAEADEMRALVRRAAGDLDGAIAVAREALARIGVRIPPGTDRVRLAATAWGVLTTNVARARRQGRLDPAAMAVQAPLMRTLNATGSPLFEQEPMRAVMFAMSGIPARLVAGTAAGAGAHSVLCAAFGAFRQAARWAALSDELQGPGQPLRATALHYSTNFGYAVVQSRHAGAERVSAMERMAYAEGDLPVAAYANRRRALDRLLGGGDLAGMAATLDGCVETARRLGDQPTLVTIQAMRQFVANLAGPEPEPWRLAGEHFDSGRFEASPLSKAVHAARHVHMLEALLCALFGAWEAGAALYARSAGCFRPPAMQLLPQSWFFLTALALYRTGGRPARWRLAVLRRHARHNPTDHRHRVLLLEAEALRTRGRAGPALLRYEAALHAARLSGCALEHALVAGVAADGARDLGHAEAARRHAQARDGLLARLGATALLAHHGVEAAAPAEPGRLRELDAARDAAERTSRAKSRLLAEVAHELRTPLQGAVELLAAREAAPADGDAAALRDTLRHLATVVDDLADMGALEAGGIALTSAPFDPRRVVEQVREMLAAQAGARPVVIVGGPTPAVLGDEVRLRQVVSNLLTNALKHGRGAVTLAVDVTLHGRQADLRIEVMDEGPGLTAHELATVFEPFKRSAEARETEGLGLGLPIARRIARAMEGDLTARPRAGGTAFVFEVRLPVPADSPRAPEPHPQRVLLVEDVDLSRRVLTKLLAEQGCQVIEAADGLEALGLALAEPVDRVLTDQRMPGLNGSELCRRLRQGGFTGPIALASGADEPELREAVAGLEDVTVMSKPVDRGMLRSWLAAASQPRRAAVLQARVAELADALGPDAAAIFQEVPAQLERLAAELASALERLEAEEIVAASHRLAGFAAHFGLAEVAERSRRLQREAMAGPLAASAAASAARAVFEAARAVDWSPFGTGPREATAARLRDGETEPAL